MNDETINQYYMFPHTRVKASHRCKPATAVYTPHDSTLHVANSAAAGRGTQSDKANAHPGNMRDAAIP